MTYKERRIFILALGIIFSSGCTSTTTNPPNNTPDEPLVSSANTPKIVVKDEPKGPRPQPDWISGESLHFTRLQYIMGRGEGESLAQAENQARANIAKIFEVIVQENSSDLQRFMYKTNAPADKTSSEIKINLQATMQTNQIVSAIKIADVWHDTETGKHHALATLSRHKTESTLRREIKKLDSATAEYDEAAYANTEPLIKIGYASKAWAAQRQRAAIQKSMLVVDVTGRGLAPKWEAAKLEVDLDRLLKELHVTPHNNTFNKEIDMNQLLAGALAAAGLPTGDKRNPDLRLSGTLEITDLGERDGWSWARGALQIQLSSASNGEVRGTKNWNIQVAGLSTDAARRRVIEKAEYTLKKEMRNTLLEIAMQ